jgi:hypothetical protein
MKESQKCYAKLKNLHKFQENASHLENVNAQLQRANKCLPAVGGGGELEFW